MATKEVSILLVAKDLASGNIRKVRSELGGLSASGKVAAVGMGSTGLAARNMGQALGHARGVIGGVVSSVGLLGGTFAAFAGAGAVGAAVKSAMNFQQQMELIRTQAGATQGEVNRMTKSVMAMAPAVAVGPEQLAMGLYHIESVGLRGAKALEVLKAAAQGSRVGLADMESVTNALAAAAYSGIKGVQNMQEAMGALDAIVGAGNMRMQDLADALGTGVLSSARAAGLSLQDTGAALAVLTDQGQHADMAATHLRMTFALMQAPTSKARDMLKSIGLNASSLATDMRKPDGLLVALKDLYAHLKKAGEVLPNGELSTKGAQSLLGAFGGGKSGTTMEILVQSLGKLEAKYKIIGEQTSKFGDKVGATAETAAFKFKRFQASMDALGIVLGNVLLPGFADLASAGATALSDNQGGIVGGLHAAVDAAKLLGIALTGVFKAVGGIAGLIGKLPGGNLAMEGLLAGAIGGKASSMLFGKNPFTWLLGSIGRKLGLGGKAGGAIGGLAGSAAGAVPVYVTNMPAGGMGGGAPTGAVGGATAAQIAAAAPGILASTAAGAGMVAQPILNFLTAQDLAMKQGATAAQVSDLPGLVRGGFDILTNPLRDIAAAITGGLAGVAGSLGNANFTFNSAVAGITSGGYAPGLGRRVTHSSGGRSGRIGIEKNRHRAFGGPVGRGLAYLVGENGPELFQPDESGQIIPMAHGGFVKGHIPWNKGRHTGHHAAGVQDVFVTNWPGQAMSTFGGSSASSSSGSAGGGFHVLRLGDITSAAHAAALHVTVKSHHSAREAHKAHVTFRRYGNSVGSVTID